VTDCTALEAVMLNYVHSFLTRENEVEVDFHVQNDGVTSVSIGDVTFFFDSKKDAIQVITTIACQLNNNYEKYQNGWKDTIRLEGK